MKARIGIPFGGRVIQTVSLNKTVIWSGGFQKADGLGRATAGPDFIYFNDVGPGDYKLAISYAGDATSFTPQPLIYPISSVREDAKTSGNWGGVHGRDGYVLFDYDGVHRDRRQLPSYVASVQPSSRKNGGCLHAQLATSTGDQRAPSSGPRNEPMRNVGQLYTGDPVACQQTMTVDVEVLDNRKCKVALYFVDWDRVGRRQAVEVFDLKTLNRIAPVKIVQDFAQGKYLIYLCSCSVRFRIDQVRGENAVLNAIFFDSAL